MPLDTIHTIDVAQALYLLALYLTSNSYERVLKDSSVELGFPFISDTIDTIGQRSIPMSDTWTTMDTIVSEADKVSIPLFDVNDDGSTTQEKLAKTVADVWGVKYGFLNSSLAALVHQFAKVTNET
jgi:hypothetical protein